MIELQFSTQDTLQSWAIRQFTWSPYSHVDIVLPDGSLLGSRPDTGVSLQRIEHAAFARSERFVVDAPQRVIELAISQLGKPYDWAAVCGHVLRRDWQDRRRWYCSELITWAFAKAGRPLLRVQRYARITPRDLLLSPYLAPVPAGILPAS